MIPILYEHSEPSFTSNGICRLPDIVSGIVTEERNGVYECEFTYPISGRNFSEIQEGRIIACYHDDTKTIQPFDIYSRSQPIDGLVTFYAHHVSYRLSKIIINPPLEASSCAQAISQLDSGTYFMQSDSCSIFSFWTDKSVSASFNIKIPTPVREILGGNEGSILDVYGKGEYEFDKFNVKLHLNRGSDRNVVIRYGKNLTEFKYDTDISECYDAVAPYWQGTEYDSETGIESDIVVTLSEGYIMRSYSSGEDIPVSPKEISPLDLSSYFDNPPTESQLRTKAQSLLDKSTAWQGKESFDVSFARLWESGDYETYASLQRVFLCDTVTVVNPNIQGLEIKMEVIKVVYDFLDEKYKSMELGSPKRNFADSITGSIYDTIGAYLKSYPTKSFLEAAIDHATQLITGGLGGHVIIKTNANGEPEEILIMDTDDPSTAVKVWRWNLNGLGYSNTGYNGPFGLAMTMDGQIVADYITTGTLNANIIKAGILSDRLNNNWWNLDTGELHISASTLNMEVGGTNIIRETRDLPVTGSPRWWLNASKVSIVNESGNDSYFKAAQFQRTNGGYLEGVTGKFASDYLGKNILVSFDFKRILLDSQSSPLSSGDVRVRLELSTEKYGSSGNDVYNSYKTIDTSEFAIDETKRVSVVFPNISDSDFTSHVANKYLTICIYGTGDHGEFQISRIKAEIGDIATDWSPAPEDDENAIQEVHDQYSTLSNTVNGISTEVGRIDSDLDSLSTDVSSISQQADQISARVDSFRMIGGSNLIRASYSMPTTGGDRWYVNSASSIDQDGDIDMDTGEFIPSAPAIATLSGTYGLRGQTGLKIGDYCGADILIEGQEEKYITVSFDALASVQNDIKNIRVGIYLSNTSYASTLYGWATNVISSNKLILGKTVRLSTTFGPINPSYFSFNSGKSYSDNLYFSIILSAGSSSQAVTSLKISKVKAEVGQVATDWTNESSDDIAHSFAEFTIRAGEISSKVGKGEVISCINQSAESVGINANKITFAGKTINFRTTNIVLTSTSDGDAGNNYFGDDDDILIVPEVNDKPVRPIRIGGTIGYLRFGCTNMQSLVEIFVGNDSDGIDEIILGNYNIGSGTNRLLRVSASQRLELLCGNTGIVITSSGINFYKNGSVIETW